VHRLRKHHYVENSIQYKLVQKRQQAVERNRLYRALQRQQQVNSNNDEETVKKRQQAAERQRRQRAKKIAAETCVHQLGEPLGSLRTNNIQA
jgi:ABC-type Fe3+/spermidine/putrescine transport system ATPase subunit